MLSLGSKIYKCKYYIVLCLSRIYQQILKKLMLFSIHHYNQHMQAVAKEAIHLICIKFANKICVYRKKICQARVSPYSYFFFCGTIYQSVWGKSLNSWINSHAPCGCFDQITWLCFPQLACELIAWTNRKERACRQSVWLF